MPVSVTMPALGESVSEGTVTRWLKQEGDQVQADEPLLEVSTDKVDTEIPSPASGVLTKIVVSEDETVDVGTELAVIGDNADDGGGTDSSGTADDEPEPASADASAEASADGGSSEDAGAEDGMGGDQADQRVAEAASREQSDQPAEPEPTQEQQGAGSDGAEQAAGSDGAEQVPPAGADEKSDGGTAVTMPALGESVTEGTVTRWLKSVGDEIAVDEPLLEVSTDKVDTEIPSPVAGTLLKITVNEDETVEVGAELAMIGSGAAGEQAAADSDDGPAGEPDTTETDTDVDAGSDAERDAHTDAESDTGSDAATGEASASGEGGKPAASGDADTASADSKAAATGAGTEPDQGAGDGAAAYVTPLVRKLAAEHDVDLSTVTGTGVGGRIRKQDVLAAAKPAEPEPAPEPRAPAAVSTGTAPASGTAAAAAPPAAALRGKTEKLSRLRTVIAKRMVESLQVSAQLTTVVEVDLSRIARLRNEVKDDFAAREGVKLSFLPFFALATVEALKEHPRVNSSVDMDAGTVTYHDSENLGVAVDTERGLLVPVIHDAGDLNLGGIARKIADLADRTRRNKITPDELGGGTFTLTNTGSRGALFDTPIINQPQSAILGTGTVVKRPVMIADDELGEIVAIRSMVYLALSYDHRIIDGADAARFLVSMKERLEGGHFESALGLA